MTSEPIPPNRQEALVARWMARARAGTEGDIFDMIAEAAHADIVVHTPNGSIGGLDLMQQYANLLRTALPDLTVQVEAVSFAYDRVLVQVEFQGTHTGRLGFLEPTGRSVSSPGAVVARLDDDGQILELWGYLNLGAAIFTPPRPQS